MGHLGRGVDHQLVVAVIPVGDDRLAFHRHHGVARQHDLALDHDGGLAGARLVLAVGTEGDEQIVGPVLVHARRRVGERGVGVDQRRQILDLELDALEDVLGLGAGGRDRERDRLADEAHLAVGQRRMLALAIARHGRARDHRIEPVEVDTREHDVLFAGRLDDLDDAAVGDRAAEERDLALPRQEHVGDVVAASVQKAGVLLAEDAGADALLAAGRGGAHFGSGLLKRYESSGNSATRNQKFDSSRNCFHGP